MPGAASAAAASIAIARGLLIARKPIMRGRTAEMRPVAVAGVCETRAVSIALLTLALVALAAAAALAVSLRRSMASSAILASRAAVAVRDAEDAERRRRETFKDLPFTALRVDSGGRLAEANLHALERFPFLVAGMTVLEAFSEHRFAERVEVALSTLERETFELRLFAAGRRTYQVAVAPYEVGGEPEALVFLTDASEAADYRELRSQFVANVSHELRTPLTGLRGLLEALGDPQMDPETHDDFVRRATSETLRLEALVTDILFLSELESTSGLPASSRTDLAAAAAETVHELSEVAGEHGAVLSLDLGDDAQVPLTERMARMVVRNLVENAIKYAGPGATTRTSVRREGGTVVLTVADDGAGIPERDLPHVFERFYRADPSRSKRLGGTGLGLSIVKHIAERFGGGAVATSREGFGTTVTVSIPASAGSGGDLPDAAAAP
jgi:two-component system phosphate regulon sensor histidine kinase PhoR